MRKLFLIILNPQESSIIRERIESLGDYYVIYDNQYFVILDSETAKGVYSKIVKEEENISGVVVLEIQDINNFNYWGYAERGLWSWLNKHIKPN